MVRQRLDDELKTVFDVNESIATIFAETEAVFLDFDGPVTDLFINGRNQAIADQMRAVLSDLGVNLHEPAASTKDPLAVLRWTAEHCTPSQLRTVEHACIDGETQATSVSAPSRGSHAFILACHQDARPLVILSNNAPRAITNYLKRHHLDHVVAGIVGRIVGRPDLMKPHQALVDQALSLVQMSAIHVAFIGDSLTDAEVAERTGLRFIGYAKTTRRGAQLADAGHAVQTDNMATLATLIEQASRSTSR